MLTILSQDHWLVLLQFVQPDDFKSLHCTCTTIHEFIHSIFTTIGNFESDLMKKYRWFYLFRQIQLGRAHWGFREIQLDLNDVPHIFASSDSDFHFCFFTDNKIRTIRLDPKSLKTQEIEFNPKQEFRFYNDDFKGDWCDLPVESPDLFTDELMKPELKQKTRFGWDFTQLDSECRLSRNSIITIRPIFGAQDFELYWNENLPEFKVTDLWFRIEKYCDATLIIIGSNEKHQNVFYFDYGNLTSSSKKRKSIRFKQICPFHKTDPKLTIPYISENETLEISNGEGNFKVILSILFRQYDVFFKIPNEKINYIENVRFGISPIRKVLKCANYAISQSDTWPYFWSVTRLKEKLSYDCPKILLNLPFNALLGSDNRQLYVCQFSRDEYSKYKLNIRIDNDTDYVFYWQNGIVIINQFTLKMRVYFFTL